MRSKAIRDLRGKAVLVTGGTMGIGLETALAFAREGAACILTYKWGTADEDDVYRRFREVGGLPPEIQRADAGSAEDTRSLLLELRERHESIDTIVSNVSAALMVGDLKDYSAKALFRTIEYSAWPMVEYTLRIHEIFGRYPRYVVGMSSTGVGSWAQGYDFMAASKAVMETLCRYLCYRLRNEDVRINVVRSGMVRTHSLTETFGQDMQAFFGRFMRDEHYLEARDVAGAVLALSSGLMDAYNGQVLTVDRGTSFFDNALRLYNERHELGIGAAQA